MDFAKVIAEELSLPIAGVETTLKLVAEGATVPFIARYRKDQTGGLDEIQLRDLQHKLEYYTELAERKATVLKTIEEQGKLTPELRAQIEVCRDKTILEDIYLPYKPKKRTKATIARELGLEPLAREIEKQEPTSNKPEIMALPFLSEEKGLTDPTVAINHALDILAEETSENPGYRQWIRHAAEKQGILLSKVRKEFEGKPSKFENYYNFTEPVSRVPSHRMLAIRRGEKEKVLRVSIELDQEYMVGYLVKQVVKPHAENPWVPFLERMCRDAWERLMYPSLETEVRLVLKEIAEAEALKVFGKNMRDILLAAPAGHKATLAVDPGFLHGCKLAVLDANGKFVDKAFIYPHEPKNQVVESARVVLELCEKHKVELIAIGNGTASRESDAFIHKLLPKMNPRPVKVIVNESGASIYSASMLAIEEFPNEDVNTRGSISIGRRLQDPLAELVKVDPKSIGVGQYQHDVNQKDLSKVLDEAVESCVNLVGVDLNSASHALLGYVAGVSKTLAKSIVDYRDKNGSFKSRTELQQIKGFGPKAFEQAAGFLRIPGAENPLDCSAVHPEQYPLVEKMAAKAGVDVKSLVGNASAVKSLPLEEFIDDKVGKHTLQDIFSELEKPNRDPRAAFEYAKFDSKIQEINDLVTGSWLEGVVTNVTNFGAFVDIGVHQDGLIHISEMSDTKYVKDAKEFLTVGQVVKVRVLGVDAGQKRISLSMKQEVAEGQAEGARGQSVREQRRDGQGGRDGQGRGQGRDGQRGGYQGGQGRGPQQGGHGAQGGRPTPKPIESHATIADLKNKLMGKEAPKANKPKVPQPVKLSVSLKSIMRSGR